MKSKKLVALVSAVSMLGAAVCAMPLSANAAAGDDIINTGHMEYAGADNIPYYWNTDKNEETQTGSTIGRSEEFVHGGKYSLKVSNRTGSGKDKGFAGNYFNAPTVGKTYKITAYIYATETDTFKATSLNGYWKEPATVPSVECKAGEWTELTGDVTIDEWEGGLFKIWSLNSAADFYVDDVSMVEQSDKEYVAGEICDQISLGNAFAAGGDYKVTEGFTASKSTSMSDEATSTKGTVDGQNNAITYTSTTPMLDIAKTSTDPSWTFSNITFSGKGRFVVIENTQASVIIKDASFDTPSDNYALINRNGHLTLDNVVFPARTDGKYDVMCQWGSGVNVLKGATKVRLYREAEYYNVDITGLTKGADVYLGFAKSIDYENVKAQAISSDLVMDCDNTNMTIHVYDKPVAPTELTGTIAVVGQYSGDKYEGEATAMTATFSGVKGTYTTASVATTDAELTAPAAITGQFTDANIVFGIVVPKVYADADKGASLFTATLK